jgi:hypothetical protein
MAVGGLLVAGLLAVCGAGVPVQGRAAAATGPSYWGEIPAPADSVTCASHQIPRPLWETALLVPYRIVALPFSLLRLGLRESVVYLDESGAVRSLGKLIGPQRGPFGVAVSFRAGSLSGIGGGLTATHDSFLAPGNQLKLHWSSTDRGSHKVSVGIAFRTRSSTRAVFGAGYRARPNARYFGIGCLAAESLESVYTQEASWAGLSLRHDFWRHLTADATLIYSGVGTRGPGDDDDIAIDERFTRPPIGYRDHSEGLTLSLALIHDTTIERGRPQRGHILRVKASRFEQTRGALRVPLGVPDAYGHADAAFWSLRGEIQQFVPLWLTLRALALRAHLTWIEPDRATVVPFQRLLTNDDPDLMRGYRDLRWRDRGLAVMSAEYRWPLWSNKDNVGLGVDSYLFTDVGQVFGTFEDISAAHVTFSYGWGLRLIGQRGFQGRFEMAWSEEETVFRLRTDQIFQFSKGGLQHGRDQVALR